MGSNLHNAINYINSTLPIDPTKAIITKIDGNCVITSTMLAQVESSWRVGDDAVGFQLLLEEIDPSTEEYKILPYTLKYGFAGYQTRWLPYGNVLAPGGVGFMSAFCLPLQLVNSYGNWDPWLIQEDNLTWSRAVVGARTFPRFEFIRSVVFNAPPMTWHDQFKQLERSFGQSLRAHVVMYSNMKICSPRVIYLLSGLFMDLTSRWQGLYTAVFVLQQLTGYYSLDWRVWVALLLLQFLTIAVSAVHQTEVHKPNTFLQRVHVFGSFVLLQVPFGVLLVLFSCYMYVRSWIACESCESYHTTGVVSKK